MEELLLGALLAGDKLDIVDRQQVGLAVLFLKFGGGAVADGQNQLVGEFLALDVQQPVFGVGLPDPAADGVNQVGLAQSAAAVQKQRVVAFGGVVGHRPGGGVRQAVAGADHEGLEGILLFGLELRLGGGRGGRGGRRLAGEDLHLHGEAHDLLKTAGKQRVVFFVDDIAAELRAAQQPGGGAVQRNHLQLADPQVVGDLGHLLAAKLLYPVKHIGKRIHTEPHFIIPPAGGRYLFNIVAYSGVKYNNNKPQTPRFFPRKNRQMCKIFRPAAARAPAGTALSATPSH